MNYPIKLNAGELQYIIARIDNSRPLLKAKLARKLERLQSLEQQAAQMDATRRGQAASRRIR